MKVFVLILRPVLNYGHNISVPQVTVIQGLYCVCVCVCVCMYIYIYIYMGRVYAGAMAT